MPFKLISSEGDQTYELRDGATLVVGRALGSDVPIFDPTVSRKHAELVADANGVNVRDLESSNGTFLNGARITSGYARRDDAVMFGKVEFRLRHVAPVQTIPTGVDQLATAFPGPGATIVRQKAVRDSRNPYTSVLRVEDLDGARQAVALASSEQDRRQARLGVLLKVSTELSRAYHVDELLDKIAGFVFQIMDVDRVAILLVNAQGELVPKISRDRRGTDAHRAVPQSIARKVVEEKAAILSDNAPEDQRFGGQSILMQSVRSAMCAPLIGSDDGVLGILYVDNLTTTHRFGDEDLEFLMAFSGIAGVAIENNVFAERIRRELLVRSNFERYFAPALASRIAASPEAVRLGGEKRPVAVLFSDIRGFTALSETMSPGDMASLLTEYFTEMVNCVFRHSGTLDKFIGDAVMAQWGAPLSAPDDADRAMRSALDMMRELRALNAKWRNENRPTLQIGIGLNFGEAFAGNIGSEQRLEYTVIGDAVNTASRLCSAAGPGEILLTDEMRRALAQTPALEAMAPMELKGKSQPVPVYRVML